MNQSSSKLSSIFQFAFLSLFCGLLLTGCGSTTEQKQTDGHLNTNALINETSPYLLQHAHNPVDWNPWGDKALKKADKENKLLIISVGYAACHWCHVMEHESFEDTTIANLMNSGYVSIKVDREERPDVDQLYMDAAQSMNGGGGWPLNVLALPNGKPFYSGTYFTKSQWTEVLNHFTEVQKNDPQSLVDRADQVAQGLEVADDLELKGTPSAFTVEALAQGFDVMVSNLDFEKGGLNQAPKFPMPSFWEYALQYEHLTHDKTAEKAISTTLKGMSYGGIYDHVGGGFARYSTDENWHIPHFEKMLYDNAQLVSLYAHAWQADKNPEYKQVVYETLAFVKRELTAPNGSFYSSLDADSDGEEGKFYVWTKNEITTHLGENAAIFSEFYGVSKRGNWEHGKNVLFKSSSIVDFAKAKNMSVSELTEILESCKSILLAERSKRVRPPLDDKQLTSWNALMLHGYIDAYRAFDDPEFLTVALKNANFLYGNSQKHKGELMRSFKNGKHSIHGFLDDYALTIDAFIDLYQATLDEKWILRAKEMNKYAIKHFYDDSSGLFYYTHDDHSDLISRKRDISDNVIPSSNSAMAKNLFVLGQYFYEDSYLTKAKKMMTITSGRTVENPYFYSNWSRLFVHLTKAPYDVAIVGNNCLEIRKKMDKNYLPNVFFYGGKTEGKLETLEGKLVENETTIYVCQNNTCQRPVTSAKDALEQLK